MDIAPLCHWLETTAPTHEAVRFANTAQPAPEAVTAAVPHHSFSESLLRLGEMLCNAMPRNPSRGLEADETEAGL